MEYNDNEYLFDISNLMKEIYETAVVFVTKKDYADLIFTTLCSVRQSLQKGENNRIKELIFDYNLHWLHAVNDVEGFRKSHEDDITKDILAELVSYTVDALNHRLRRYQNYMACSLIDLNDIDKVSIQADVEVVGDMHREVTNTLDHNILKAIRQLKTDLDLTVKTKEITNELLHWIDKIHDGLSLMLSKYFKVHNPKLVGDMTKILQTIVIELQVTHSESMLEEVRKEGKEIGSMIRLTTGHSLEMSKVFEKLNLLDYRIKGLSTDSLKPSAALLALKHKKDFLEKRLLSIENLKTNLKSVRDMTSVPIDDIPEEELCVCEDFFELKIFNHSLPIEAREHLVTELCGLWDIAIMGDRGDKSIISILSATDIKEEYTDELGTFITDEHGRKIYKLPEDDTHYQPNERHELVPVSDDADHIYFYDDCGRYYLDKKARQRVYKAHATASEYMMDSFGILLKVKEERDGVTYYYDNFGRYYINEEGKHVYREEDTASEYENDGLGNLVRIRSHLDIFEPCPDDAHVTEDCRYLKESVGKALRECIAQVLLYQPCDPIKFLSQSLIKYRDNIEQRDKRAREQEQLNVEREIVAAEERATAERAAMEAALLLQGGSEASFDSNLMKYSTQYKYDPHSTGASTK